MRKIIFNEFQFNKDKQGGEVQNAVVKKSERLPEEKYLSLVNKAEEEQFTSKRSIDDARSREAELMGLRNRSPYENAEMTGLRHFIDGTNKYGDKYRPFNVRHKKSNSTVSESENMYDPEDEVFTEGISPEEKSDIALTLKNTYAGASKDQILYAMAQIKMQLKNSKDKSAKKILAEKLKVLKILYSSAKTLEKKIDKKIKK